MARGDGDAGGVGPSMRGARHPSFLRAAERGWRAGMAMRVGSDLPCAGMVMHGASGAQRAGARERERATAGITVHQNVCVRLHYCVIE
jgi:hypothetical protein